VHFLSVENQVQNHTGNLVGSQGLLPANSLILKP
jgi:hypothetical protein